MGTADSYDGASDKSPLIPDFVNDPAPASDPMLPGPAPDVPPNAPDEPAAPAPGQPDTPPAAPEPRAVPQQQPVADRFRAPRTNFTRFARSGGSDRHALARAISDYISSGAGGARQAAQRMGPQRRAAARLYSFLGDALTRGPVEALRALNLEALAGRPIEEIFLGVAEYVCPVGGTVDEGIARDAFMETVAELADQGLKDFDALTPDQLQTVFEMFVTHTVEARICNEIGKNSIKLPADVAAVERVQAQLHDFVARGVSDALTAAHALRGGFTQEQALREVDVIYEAAFDLLQMLADAEAEA